ncbi:MAG: hypothetical protein WCK09_13255 [Bacteroidota bacterium]
MNQKHLPSPHRVKRPLILITLFAAVVWAMVFIAGIETGRAQTLIAGWDFQTTTNGGTAAAVAPSSPTIFLANVGSGTIYLNGSNNSSSWITATSGNEITSFGGSNLNTSGTGFSTTITSPACIALLGGTLTGGFYTANGKCLVFSFSMTGYQNLVVSYATQRTNTGFTTQVWDYSTDGTNWNSVQTLSGLPTSFGVQTLSTITGLNNASTAYLRLTLTGATASSGNNRIDNIQFNATIPVSNSITLSPATQNFGPFCNSTSNSVSLTYTTTGTVTLPYIELSDASGGFASGTLNLGGTITPGTPNTITANIPQNQAAGTYRIRIKSMDVTPVISADNGSNIIINPLPAVSFSLATTVNADAIVTLTGSPAGGTFSGPGVSGNTFTASVAGIGGPYTISYSYTNENGCSNSVSNQVTVLASYTGPSTASTPYIIPVTPGEITTSVLTVPEAIGG